MNKHERSAVDLFTLIGANIAKDGNQWCVLFGDDIQAGICGFGDTPIIAIRDFQYNFFNETIIVPETKGDKI